MASYVSDQDREADLSCPSKCKNSGLRRGVRRPAGGGLISRLSVPLLFCFPLAVLAQVGGGGVGLSWRGGCGEGGGVRTRRWGRGPAGRGLTSVTYQGLRLDPLKHKSHKWYVGNKELTKRKWNSGK